MRLTCPNCDAKYEVPDEVIPTAGRDVQCSNCGQTWFQDHPDHPSTKEDDPVADIPAPDEEVAPPPPPPAREPERRQLDPAVADILRQEAEAEYEARRRRQSESLETQPDLGLPEADEDTYPEENAADETEQRALEAKKRMARMRGEPDPTPVAAQGKRRELLPDIEEINSTLRRENKRSESDADTHGDVDAAHEATRSNGFRRGFMLVLLIGIAMLLVYVYAPQIAQNLPQADPYLSSYVTWVDSLRLALDGQLQRLLEWLDSMASESS